MNDAKEIRETVLSFIESEEMREHLRGRFSEISLYGVMGIIARSRAAFDDKLAALRLLAVMHDERGAGLDGIIRISDRDEDSVDELNRLIAAAEFAQGEITDNNPPGTVYLLGSYLLHEMDNATDDWDMSVPFTTFKAAKKRLLKEAKIYYDNCEDEIDWKRYAIAKWVPGTDGEMRNVMEWTLSAEGDIWFADINEDFDERQKRLAEDCELLGAYLFDELGSLSIPFRIGDIVTVDCLPTHMICHAVIADIGENENDCCSVRAVYMTEGGRMEQAVLKHNLFRPHLAMFPCLYRLAKFTGDLPPWEAPLKKVSEMLKLDPSLGLDDEGGFVERTGFDENIKNFLPDTTDVGDIIVITSLCDECGALSEDRYALIVDMGGDSDNVAVIIYKRVKYKNESKLYWAMLNNELGSIKGFCFEKPTGDDLSKQGFSPLIRLGERLKSDPALANDDDLLKQVHEEIKNAD